MSAAQPHQSTDNKIRVLLDHFPFLQAFREAPGDLDGYEIEFDESFKPVFRGFRAMAEQQAFDISEMAMATYVQARASGRPVAILPVTVMARFQHDQLTVLEASELEQPAELAGRRVGVRSYSQTTGLWVRTFLRRQYGVSPREITWVVFEAPHVQGFEMPSNVVMAPDGKDMLGMLREGQIDAMIGFEGEADDIRTLLRDPVAGAREWYELTHLMTANHVLTVSERFLEREPDLVHRIYSSIRDLVATQNAAIARTAGADPAWSWAADFERLPTGQHLMDVLAVAGQEAFEQGLVPQALDLAQLTDPTVTTWLREQGTTTDEFETRRGASMPFRPSVIREIERADKEHVDGLAQFGVATIHEANRRTGLMHGIHAVTGGVRIAGTAVTSLDFAGDNLMLQTAIDAAQPGDVLVAAVTSPSQHGMYGELLATLCRARGIAGVILAAAARDASEIREMAYPVWSSTISATGTIKVSPGWVNIPVSCGGVVVNPGDIVVADDDGVVIVARADAADVLEASRQREDSEAASRTRFQAGEASIDVAGLRSLVQPYVQER